MKKLVFIFLMAGTLNAARVDKPGSKIESAALPRFFEVNHGQAADAVRYLTREPGYTAFFLDSEVGFVFPRLRPAPVEPIFSLKPPRHAEPLPPDLLRMRWSGGRSVRPTAEDLQPGVSHYYVSNDPKHWYPDVPHFAGLSYRNIYDGIDLTFGLKDGDSSTSSPSLPAGNLRKSV